MNLVIQRHRKTDPETSVIGAHGVAQRAPSQMMRLLMTYVDRARTDDEAAAQAGLLSTGYWKRCSDLRTLELIEPVKIGGILLTRRGAHGSPCMVCRITSDGRDELRKRGLL